jgi:hypothetical protein
MQQNLNEHYLNIKRKFFGAPKTPIVRLPKDPALNSKTKSSISPPTQPAPEPNLFEGCDTLSTRRKQMILPLLKESGFTWAELMSGSRQHRYLGTRAQIYMVLREDGVSLPEIGRMCGGKDHTTIMHAIRKFKGEE